MTNDKLDRKDLKIIAYKERVADLEESNADLRVEVTVVTNELQRVNAILSELEDSSVQEEAEDIPAD